MGTRKKLVEWVNKRVYGGTSVKGGYLEALEYVQNGTSRHLKVYGQIRCVNKLDRKPIPIRFVYKCTRWIGLKSRDEVEVVVEEKEELEDSKWDNCEGTNTPPLVSLPPLSRQ
ncbi:hypothetical protein M0802_006145 [Mischocyttarus mexicanus]|nr:hypothetical protein M0802_006145 [Mischocyttarus mexicanus]